MFDTQDPRRIHFRDSLSKDHPVATLMREHDHILENLTRLEGLVESKDTPVQSDLEKIRDVGAFLISVEPHHTREEDVIFPAMRDRGVGGPADVMEQEHAILRPLKHGIRDGAAALIDGGDESWDKLRGTAISLIDMLRQHIHKEDFVLYPMAVKAIVDEESWASMKKRCDEIGYCCHQPS